MAEDSLAEEIIKAFLMGVAEGASKRFPSPKQAGKVLGRKMTGQKTQPGLITAAVKVRRKPGRYQILYGKNFRKVQGKYKKKNGSWKANGFRNAQKEAHKLTKREMKK